MRASPGAGGVRVSVPWGRWGAGGTAVLRPPGSKGQSLSPFRISRSLEWSWRHEGAQLSARTGLVSRTLCLGGWLAVTGSPKPGFLLPSSLGNQGGPARLGTSEPGSGCVVEPCPRLVGTLGGCALSGSPGSPVSREGGCCAPRLLLPFVLQAPASFCHKRAPKGRCTEDLGRPVPRAVPPGGAGDPGWCSAKPPGPAVPPGVGLSQGSIASLESNVGSGHHLGAGAGGPAGRRGGCRPARRGAGGTEEGWPRL